MKKLFILLLTLGSITSVFAQRGHQNNQSGGYNEGRYDDHSSVYNDHRYDDRKWDDRTRRDEVDRLNRDYDQRINTYRSDRSISSYERNRRIAAAERERKEKSKALIKGAVLGGVAGVVLGVLLSK